MPFSQVIATNQPVVQHVCGVAKSSRRGSGACAIGLSGSRRASQYARAEPVYRSTELVVGRIHYPA